MSAADTVLYPANASPSWHKQLSCAQCLELILPLAQASRRASRNARAIAEVNFASGLTLKFESQTGRIHLHQQRPMFGKSRKLMGLIPVPIRTETSFDATDFSIHQMVSKAFGTTVHIQ